MVPALCEILADDELSHAYANFRIDAGDEEGAHEGPPFWDGDLNKWLEANERANVDSTEAQNENKQTVLY